MNQITPFQFELTEIRVRLDDEGNPWWVAADVAAALDMGHHRDVIRHLEPDTVRVDSIDTNKGSRDTAFINESGLYDFILQSRKPKAVAFRRWVTRDVLPSIRKTGSYSVSQSLPQSFAEALRLAADQAEQIERQSQQLIEQAPKVEFAEALQASEDEFDLSTVAKMVGWGTIKLYAKLREVPTSQPFLLRYSGNLNLPSDTYVKLGYARVIATPYDQKHRDGRITKHVSRKTVITMRGVQAIRRWIG